MTAFFVISLTHIDVVTILHARVFGVFDKGTLFNAPFSRATSKQLSWFGLVGNFLEDIPQLGIQMVCMSFRTPLFSGVVLRGTSRFLDLCSCLYLWEKNGILWSQGRNSCGIVHQPRIYKKMNVPRFPALNRVSCDFPVDQSWQCCMPAVGCSRTRSGFFKLVFFLT